METSTELPQQPTKKEKQKAAYRKIKQIMKSRLLTETLPSVAPRRFQVKTRNRRKNKPGRR